MQTFNLKSLNTYSSPEWLAFERKKYRNVFLSQNVDYIYFEVSFFNLNYEIDDWNARIDITCKRKENDIFTTVCDLRYDRVIRKNQSIFTLREGWGNAIKGRFWRKGEYLWEVKINDLALGTKTFYVEEFQNNPSVENIVQINNIAVTEGPDHGIDENTAIQYHTFDKKNTRFVYVILYFDNLNIGKGNWWTEIFLNFYSETRELKGIASKTLLVASGEEHFNISLGWGTNSPGSWYEGLYSIDVVMFEKHLATISFDMADEFIEGEPEVFYPEDFQTTASGTFPESEDITLDQLLQSLDNLVGLEEIKTQIKNHAKYIQFINLRKEKGFREDNELGLHMVFTGNPGTGKTTVAEMMGMIYKKMGILSIGHVHSVDRVDLVGEYIGQTAPKVKEAIEKAKGGVLFIDEAYSLSRENSDSKDFGREVIEILVKEMSDGDGDLVVIAAGYPKEMDYFINSNPGLKSRFKLYFNFPDYLPQELSQIALIAADKKEVVLSESAVVRLNELIIKAYRERDRSFGNARFVYDLIEKAKINMALRLMSDENFKSLEKAELSTIEEADVEKIELGRSKSLPKIPIDEKLLQEAFEELNKLIGLEKVKQEILETVGVVRYHLETGKNVLNSFFLHTVFIGNPGTGKTTVARILTKIYKALGILERGHMVETDRQGLVAGYVGQTAMKTAEKIDEAMGGVLFIDEAYSLSGGNSSNDFGPEAIQTLLKRMEDRRGEFFVFVAGYPEDMEKFLNANPGLKSRFDKMLKFEDYDASQLLKIATDMFAEKELITTPDANEAMSSYFIKISKKRDKYFGNGRKVRTIVIEIIENQNIRIANLPPEERNNIDTNLVTVEDVQKAILEEKTIFDKKNIGFRAENRG
ncbi:MAG: AAA family ATPase [Deltaproteobacteria bacterium]